MLLNQPRAREWMRRANVDALVATSGVNVQYLTDYYWWLDPINKEYMGNPGASSDLTALFALLPLEGEPALVLNSLLAINAADIWVKDIHVFGSAPIERVSPPPELAPALKRFYDLVTAAPRHATPLDAFVEIVRSRGLERGRIGIEMDGLSAERRAALRERLPHVELLDCSNFLRFIRAVKSAEELARLRRAAEISELAAQTSLGHVFANKPVAGLIESYRTLVAEGGAQFDHFAYTPHGLGIAIEPHYVFQPGDTMYIDFGCIYRQYFSDSGLALTFGEPSAETSARYAALRAGIKVGVAQLRPGVTGSQVQRVMQEALSSFVTFPHGHAIGLEVRDYPILTPRNGNRLRDDCIDLDADLPLEADMVINLEGSFFRPGVDSFNIEQSWRITGDGCEPLVAQERDAMFVVET